MLINILYVKAETCLCPWFCLKLIIWNIDIHICLLDSTFLCPHLPSGNTCEMKKIIWKYNLPDIYNLLDRPDTKMQWKQIVYEKVHKKEHNIRISELYKHLGYLNINEYKPGK